MFVKAGEPLIQISLYDKNLDKAKLNINSVDEDFLEQKEKDRLLNATVSQSFSAYKVIKENEV